MVDYVRIRRNDQNEYLVQIRVAGRLLSALIDTGMTSPDCLVGVGLDRDTFSAVRSRLRLLRRVGIEGVGNLHPNSVIVGLGTASIEGLEGSETETYVAEIGENLVGVCFFHKLEGYELVWEPDAGQMIIRKRSREE